MMPFGRPLRPVVHQRDAAALFAVSTAGKSVSGSTSDSDPGGQYAFVVGEPGLDAAAPVLKLRRERRRGDQAGAGR